MLGRVPEPELMDTPEQAKAYADADFSAPHAQFVEHFAKCFPDWSGNGRVIDLGCGPADVTCRFAHRYPGCRIDAIDAGPNMLNEARLRLESQGLEQRIRLHRLHLPSPAERLDRYDAVISNSLLHHLASPDTLWQSIRQFGAAGAPWFVMDLLRPGSVDELDGLVRMHATGAPPILQTDFRNSLMASYRADEVEEQLRGAGLVDSQVRVVSDRHWIAWGFST